MKREYENKSKYEIGCYEVTGAYLSYHSAMEYYGLQNQVFNRVYLSSPKWFKMFEYDFVEYWHAPDKFRDGVVKDAARDIYYTDLERTIIDCIDRLDLAGGYEELYYNFELIDEVEESRLLFYLELYNKQALYQRAGLFLSMQSQMKLSTRFFDVCQARKGTHTNHLTDKGESRVYIPEWKLYVPQYLLNMANPVRLY
jgi:predicted transcriptional regulator of viral defense system